MNQTLSDYDMLKIRCDERQAIIDAKDAKIEMLKKSLRDIFDLTHNKQKIRLIDALYDIDQIIKNTLDEELK